MKLSAIEGPVTESVVKIGRFNLRLYTGKGGKQIFDPIDSANFITAVERGEVTDEEVEDFIVKVKGAPRAL